MTKLINKLRLEAILNRVRHEFIKASNKFPSFNSEHEGFAVLLEEIDELWQNVKLNQKNEQRLSLIVNEAIQVSAMAIRLIYDSSEAL